MKDLYFFFGGFLPFLGWGIFGWVMWKMDHSYFHDFPAWMVGIMILMGIIMGVAVLSIAKLFGAV